MVRQYHLSSLAPPTTRLPLADALAQVVAEAKAGAKVADLCALGDRLITEGAAPVFKGKAIEKGIAVPTCVSVNNCVGHCSPPRAEERRVGNEGNAAWRSRWSPEH